ncbi:MAG: Fur family transcriptional regulator [Methylotenera sp.]|jgi:Fur family transcriptional regulator, ferric uptake regulator
MENLLETADISNNAKQMIEQSGLRPTAARVAVLDLLIVANNALAHAEIIERLSDNDQYDRVTIYRVLDWLTDNHLIHRIPCDDRAVKFQVSLAHTSHQHAHLHCTQCHKIICLDTLQPSVSKQISKQFQVESVDMIIKGRCPDCKD